jgi:hypothetical protein
MRYRDSQGGNMSKIVVAVLLALSIQILSACAAARDYQLNILENSKPTRDVAPIDGADRELPYETQEKNGLAVSYNLLAGYLGDTYGYTLRIIFRNNLANPLTINPTVSLFDAEGFMQAGGLEKLTSMASELANIKMKEYAPEYRHTGEIRDSHGNSYSYSGESSSSNNTATALYNLTASKKGGEDSQRYNGSTLTGSKRTTKSLQAQPRQVLYFIQPRILASYRCAWLSM